MSKEQNKTDNFKKKCFRNKEQSLIWWNNNCLNCSDTRYNKCFMECKIYENLKLKRSEADQIGLLRETKTRFILNENCKLKQ